MATKKGTLGKIADAVGGAVHSVAAGVGLATATAPEPKSKAVRKAARKATVARAKKGRVVKR